MSSLTDQLADSSSRQFSLLSLMDSNTNSWKKIFLPYISRGSYRGLVSRITTMRNSSISKFNVSFESLCLTYYNNIYAPEL